MLELPPADRPIIILQADEGPFPYRFALDQAGFDGASAKGHELRTKFGVLNAMYLPGPEGIEPPPRDLSLANTYHEILRRYFGAVVPYEEDRSFTVKYKRPYVLTEVTDRLDEAGKDRSASASHRVSDE